MLQQIESAFSGLDVPERQPTSALMYKALIIGASGGIGAAMAQSLRHDGWSVTGLSRSRDGLDVTDPASVSRIMGDLAGPFELVVVALGILGTPEKTLSAIEAATMAEVIVVNSIGPALILKDLPRLLPKDAPATVGVLTARVGSIGDNRLGGWYSYRASKAAANQIVHCAAIEIARSHKKSCVVALHPGTVETPFTADYAARHKTMPADEAASKLLTVMQGLTSEDTGKFFDYSGAEVPW